MERRDFLRVGALAGAGAAGSMGCASLGGLEPPVAVYSPSEMQGFLDRLDAAMHATSTIDSVARFLPEGRKNPFAADDPVYVKHDQLIRKTMRSLLISGSFHDLREEDRMHPGMQERMFRSLGEMNDSMLGMHRYLTDLSPTERADVAAALREDPDLAMRAVEVLDGEAARAGVPMSRRVHMRSIAVDVVARLKQSPSLFIDEYDSKVQRLAAREGTAAQLERRLAARMGEEAFFAHRDKLVEAGRKWDVALASQHGDWQPPGSRPRRDPNEPPRGTISIIVGGTLLGVGGVMTATGAILLSTGGGLGWAIVVTVGASLALGGLITLIVGLVQRSQAEP